MRESVWGASTELLVFNSLGTLGNVVLLNDKALCVKTAGNKFKKKSYHFAYRKALREH